MKTNNRFKKITTSAIVQGALALAIISVLFLIFKGATNILNALLVPITLYTFSLIKNKSEIFITYIAAILLCAFLFISQVFLMMFYCGISILLLLLYKRVNAVFFIFILSIVICLCFYSAILLTDYIFGTNMLKITLKALNGNMLVYLMVIIIEGFIVGKAQYFFLKLINKRIHQNSITVTLQSSEVY